MSVRIVGTVIIGQPAVDHAWGEGMPDRQLSSGKRIAQLRKLGGLTQQQLAASAGYALSTVGAVGAAEQERSPSSPAFIAAAARALGRSIIEING